MPCRDCASTRTMKRPDHTALGYRRFRCCNCTRTFYGVVNLLPIDRINEAEGARRPGSSVLCGGGKARDVLPGVESLPELLTVSGGGEKVTSQAEVVGDGTIGGEEALGMPGGLEPLHAPLPLAGGLVGVFGAIVEIAMLAMFHPRQEFPHSIGFSGRHRSLDCQGRLPLYFPCAPSSQLRNLSKNNLNNINILKIHHSIRGNLRIPS